MTPTPRNGPAKARKLNVLYVQLATKSFAGIERVLDSICSALAAEYEDEFSVDVLYTSPEHQDLDLSGRAYNPIRRAAPDRRSIILNARRLIASKKYDLVVVPQVEPTVIYWLSTLGLDRRFVMYLHGNPALEQRTLKAKAYFLVMKLLVLPRMRAVFGTSPKQLKAFQTAFPSNVPHLWVPNPVRTFAVDVGQDAAAPAHGSPVTFINVGRFAYQKGQDILVRAFARTRQLRPDTRLRLVGYGPDEVSLRALILELGLEGGVTIEHHPTEPGEALSTSDIFVCTSRWEGWSLAVCEALRFGLPVVSVDCPFGPSDILTDERLGVLVPQGDEDALVEAMVRYCDSIGGERAHSEFRKSYIDRYSIERVVKMHADALRVAAGAG